MSSDRTYSIFILKVKADSLKSAEAFLKNRKWTVGSSSNLREALAYLIQKQPEFLMLAVDHPNKKVRVLPKLITQAFPVKIIAFAESQSGPAIASLQEMGEYNLFPPVSGPAIERIVLKMKRDEERRARESEERARTGGDSGEIKEDLIRLKGQQGTAADSQVAFENVRAALNQLMDSDVEETSAGTFVAKGDGNLAPASHLDRGQGPTESFSDWEERMRKQMPHNTFSPTDPAVADTAKTQPGHGSGQTPGSDTSPSEFAPDPGSDNFNSDSRRKKQAPVFEHDPLATKKKAVPTYKRDPSTQADKDSIIVKGAQAALDESVTVREELEGYQEITRASNCACIIVESARFSGYLVAALGKDRQIDKNFSDMIRQRLFSFLKAHGEVVRDEESMAIKLQEIEFEDWALEQADFLRKSIHDGDEIAMAFFPTKETTVALEESVSEKMLQMKISELKEDTVVEFDLYIYMPENNKYLLYTPQGKTLYGAQRSRLTEKGVTHMHLRKESAHNVKKYRAQNYLNEKIQAYKVAQQMKNA